MLLRAVAVIDVRPLSRAGALPRSAGLKISPCAEALFKTYHSKVRYWHQADIPSCIAHVRLGG